MSHNARALARSGLPFMLVILAPVRYAMHPCPLTFIPAPLDLSVYATWLAFIPSRCSPQRTKTMIR
jgi:hypothetical protein